MAAEIASDWGIESIGIERENGDSEVFSNQLSGKMKKETCNFLPETKNIDQVKNMDDFVLSYFESMNSMARRIIAEEREVIKEHGQRWKKLSPDEQEKIIDDRLIKPEIRKVYGMENDYDSSQKWFPLLKLSHGISDEAPPDPRRTSIISVTDMNARDQFSAPWSWETESQQELNFVDQEELEVALKDAVESDAKLGEIVVPPFGFPTKANFSGFESSESKEPSLSSSSGGGSSQMARKDYLDFDFDFKGTSLNSSTQGSKSSILSSQHSETTSPQNSTEGEVSQTVERTEIARTPAQERMNPTHVVAERGQPEEQMEREESEQRTENVKSAEPKTNESGVGTDLMAFLTDW